MNSVKFFLTVILFSFISLVLISCGDDDKNPTEPDTQIGKGLLSGIVYDIEGNKLPNVTIKAGSATTVSNSEGEFELYDAPEGSDIAIRFDLDGYSSTEKLADINSDEPFFIEVALTKITISDTISSEGGTVSSDDINVKFQSGFNDADGNIYSGQVIVEITYYKPDDEKFLEAFPGKFEGELTNGSNSLFESIGYIDIKIFTPEGETLMLPKGQSVEISLDLQPDISSGSPETIPTWYYDTNQNKWIEEGIATKNGSKYEFSISQLRIWNLAKNINENNTSTITGRVIDNTGKVLENATVRLKGINYRGLFSAMTDENGEFDFKVNENSEYEIISNYGFYSSEKKTINSPSSLEKLDIGDLVIKVNTQEIEGWYNLDFETNAPIYEIDYITRNLVFAVSDNSIYKSTNGGKSWKRFFSSGEMRSEYFNSVQFLSETKGLAINTGGLYSTIDTGNTWHGVGYFSSTTFDLNSIRYINDDLYVTGGGFLYKSTD